MCSPAGQCPDVTLTKSPIQEPAACPTPRGLRCVTPAIIQTLPMSTGNSTQLDNLLIQNQMKLNRKAVKTLQHRGRIIPTCGQAVHDLTRKSTKRWASAPQSVSRPRPVIRSPQEATCKCGHTQLDTASATLVKGLGRHNGSVLSVRGHFPAVQH